jgi:hypothetical protein
MPPAGTAARAHRPSAALRVLTALLVQGALLVWLTWPLVPRLATHRPTRPIPVTDLDAPLLAWALAHETRALAGDPASFGDGGIFYPAPHALSYGEPAFAALPVFAPAFLATGNPTLALNLTFLLGVLLTAAAVHGVVRHWTGSLLAGALAGWVFLNAPWVLTGWVPAAANYGLLFPLPLLLWLVTDPLRALRRRLAVAGLASYEALASPYLAVAVAIPLGVVGAVRLLGRRDRASGRWLLATAGLVAVVTAVAYHGPLALHAADPGLVERSVWSFANDLPRPVTHGFVWRHQPASLPLLAVSCAALGLALRALGWGAGPADGRRTWGHALAWIALGLFVSLPRVMLIGSRAYWGPWAWLSALLPAASGIRQTMRLGVLALVGLVVAAGLGWSEIAATIRRLGARVPAGGRIAPVVATAGWLAIMIGVHVTSAGHRAGDARFLLTPVPDERDEPVVQAIARLDGPVLELPITSPRDHAAAMYRAIAHRQPLLNGYSGYWPAAFAARMDLACRLPAADAVRQLQAETGLALVVVNRAHWTPRDPFDRRHGVPPNGCPHALLGPQRWQAWERVAAGGHPLLELVARDPDRLLFRVRPPAADSRPSPRHRPS